MGDVGSGTLGFLLAVLALTSHRATTVGLTGWGFLLAPFIVDATCTLCDAAFFAVSVHGNHIATMCTSARRVDGDRI